MNLAYVAGLVDGEGCIGFTQCRTNLIPRVSVTNTNKDLINLLHQAFGGCVRHQNHIKKNWKPAYHWVVTSKLAIDFLDKIGKYLILKEKQMFCLFAHAAIRPGKGLKWTDEGKEAEDLLSKQIHWLNKKGAHSEVEPILDFLKEK